MLCPKCGASIPDESAFCPQCGAVASEGQQPPVSNEAQPYSYNNGSTYNNTSYNSNPMDGQRPISSTMYLVFSILATLFCCIPLGIPAIVFACKIDKLQAAGLYQEAVEAAKKAKMWSIIAAASGVVLIIGIIIVYAVSIASFITNGQFYY